MAGTGKVKQVERPPDAAERARTLLAQGLPAQDQGLGEGDGGGAHGGVGAGRVADR